MAIELQTASNAALLGPMADNQSLKELVHNSQLSEAQKTAEATRLFESVMLKTFLQDSLKPVIKGGAIEQTGASSGIYQHFMTDILADSLSRSGAFGFSTALQSQLQRPDAIGESTEGAQLGGAVAPGQTSESMARKHLPRAR